MNIALYGQAGHHWAMTERGRRHLDRDARQLHIGPSQLAWRGGELDIAFDERTAPWGRRLHGTVRLTPSHPIGSPIGHALDWGGRHRWAPIAPCARVEVELTHPRLRWQGHAYLDTNRGQRPLEQDFRRWDWSRATLADGSTQVLYDLRRRDGTDHTLALHYPGIGPPTATDHTTQVKAIAPPEPSPLPHSGWRIARGTRCQAGAQARVRRTLEDTPFYVRSLVDTRLADEPVIAMHESLDLDRFAHPVVQAMLPFRMPRRA